MAFAIEAYRDLRQIAGEWDELASAVGAAPFLRPGWLEIWWRAFGRGRLEIFGVRDNGRLVAVLPMAQRSLSIQSPTNWHTPAFGPVCAEREAAQLLIDRILRRRARIDISLIDAADPFLGELVTRAEACDARVIERPVLRSPYIDLSGSWVEFEAGLGKEFRRQTRKHGRRLERQGTVEVDFVSDHDRLDSLLSDGFAVEGSGWKDDRGTAIRSQPSTERFYREIGRWAADRGWLQLGFLRLDGQCIAFYFSLIDGDVLYALKTGFDPSLGAFAPGTLMARAVIQQAFADGLTRFEFLGGDQRYKLHWTPKARARLRVQIFPKSLAGSASFITWTHARPIAKRARDATRGTNLPSRLRHSSPERPRGRR